MLVLGPLQSTLGALEISKKKETMALVDLPYEICFRVQGESHLKKHGYTLFINKSCKIKSHAFLLILSDLCSKIGDTGHYIPFEEI